MLFYLNIPGIDFVKSITFLLLSCSLESAAMQKIEKYLIKINDYLLNNLKILLPTGRTPWGYDWHGPSLLNIQYAIKALTNPTGIFETVYQHEAFMDL